MKKLLFLALLCAFSFGAQAASRKPQVALVWRLLFREHPVHGNINGTSGDDVIQGGLGADDIDGFGGNDRIGGNDGNDDLNGGAGNDFFNGGNGTADRCNDPSNTGQQVVSCERGTLRELGPSAATSASFGEPATANPAGVKPATIPGYRFLPR